MEYRLINHKTKKYASSYLQSIYILRNDGSEFTYGCVPNGEIGISVVLNGASDLKINGKWIRQPDVSIYGLVKQVQFHRMSPGYYEINIGFNPHFLQAFLKDSMSSLIENNSTDLIFMLKKDDVYKLHEDLFGCHTDEEILCVIEDFLKIHLVFEKIDKRILAAHTFICQKNIWKVDEISSLLNISSTRLRDLFREKVGISPKDLIKIHRINEALQTKHHDAESLTNLAYQLNYFDQSHFIHHFKEAIGVTPLQYFKNSALTFDFYNYGRFSYNSFEQIKKSIL